MVATEDPAPKPTPPDGAASPAGWTRGQRALLLLITAVAIALRLFRIEQWSWSGAEAATFRAITLPLDGEHGYFADGASQSPLVHLAQRALLEHVLPGVGEGWLRLPFAFCGVLAVPALAVLLARMVGPSAALLGAALFALHPTHIAASQSMAPLSCGLTAALLAGLVPLRSRALTVLPFVVAIGCDPTLLWTVVTALACRLSEATRSRVAPILLAIAAPVWLWYSPHFGLAMVLGAAAGFVVARHETRLVLFAAVPTVGLALGHLLFGWPLGDGLLLALPGMTGLLALVLVQTYRAVHAHVAGSMRLRATAATLPAALVFVWITVDAFLHLTAYQGQRAPWRTARDSVLASLGARGVVVGAIDGHGPLMCYLRPNHWHQERPDPHPGCRVIALAEEPGAGLEAFLRERPEAVHWLVLRADELAKLQQDAKAAAALRAFTFVRVVQAPRAHGDDTLCLLRLDRKQ